MLMTTMDGDRERLSGSSHDSDETEWNYDGDSFESHSTPDYAEEHLDLVIHGHHYSPRVASNEDIGNPNSSSDELYGSDDNEDHADSDWDEDLTILAASGDGRENFADAMQNIRRHCNLDTLCFSLVNQAKTSFSNIGTSISSRNGQSWSSTSNRLRRSRNNRWDPPEPAMQGHANMGQDQQESSVPKLTACTESPESKAETKISSPTAKLDLSSDSLVPFDTEDDMYQKSSIKSLTPESRKSESMESLTPESLLRENAKRNTNQSRINPVDSCHSINEPLRQKKTVGVRIRNYIQRKFSAFRRLLICGGDTHTKYVAGNLK